MISAYTLLLSIINMSSKLQCVKTEKDVEGTYRKSHFFRSHIQYKYIMGVVDDTNLVAHTMQCLLFVQGDVGRRFDVVATRVPPTLAVWSLSRTHYCLLLECRCGSFLPLPMIVLVFYQGISCLRLIYPVLIVNTTIQYAAKV